MVFSPEVVDKGADPAGGKDYNGGDNLSYKGDGLFENVDNCSNCKDDTDDVNNCGHIS